jgi:hypothetical protein
MPLSKTQTCREEDDMQLRRRDFLRGVAGTAAGTCLLGARAARADKGNPSAAKRIVYYNNFASHLLCAYNPNMYYPGLPHRWADADWKGLVDMIAHFGFNAFEFWLEPRMFCREALESELGREYTRQMNVVIDHARDRGMKTEMIVAIATVGEKWRTLCPNIAEEWREVRGLWDAWTRRFPGLGIVGIFPGDPGACSRNGCTAETYIDKSVELAALIKTNLPNAEVEFHTWGPPFFGWGNVYMPSDSQGEFIPKDQATAWTFSKERADKSMNHLLRRLPDFPADTSVAINLGFNGDGNPQGDRDARPWAVEIAKTNPIQTWDFSLTEGENAVYPHYRFSRLFQRRREEQAAAPYRGGICFTMTPLLNQLSLHEAARSFAQPDGDPQALAQEFFVQLFGESGRAVATLYPLFEALPDWGSYDIVQMPRGEYHAKMQQLAEALHAAKDSVNTSVPLHPSPEVYRAELEFFARLFADLTAPAPDYDTLKKTYWDRVYKIYDLLPEHVDPRPRTATDRFIQHFVDWK